MCKRGPRERGREKEGVTGLGVGLLLTAGLQPFFFFFAAYLHVFDARRASAGYGLCRSNERACME